MLHLVVYEAIKAKLASRRQMTSDNEKTYCTEYMIAGATSKTLASCICYPHGKQIYRFLTNTYYNDLYLEFLIKNLIVLKIAYYLIIFYIFK